MRSGAAAVAPDPIHRLGLAGLAPGPARATSSGSAWCRVRRCRACPSHGWRARPRLTSSTTRPSPLGRELDHLRDDRRNRQPRPGRAAPGSLGIPVTFAMAAAQPAPRREWAVRTSPRPWWTSVPWTRSTEAFGRYCPTRRGLRPEGPAARGRRLPARPRTRVAWPSWPHPTTVGSRGTPWPAAVRGMADAGLGAFEAVTAATRPTPAPALQKPGPDVRPGERGSDSTGPPNRTVRGHRHGRPRRCPTACATSSRRSDPYLSPPRPGRQPASGRAGRSGGRRGQVRRGRSGRRPRQVSVAPGQVEVDQVVR